MRQTLTRKELKALSPCDDKYLDKFGEHESMNIEQAFNAGFTINNICWLMGELDKRAEILAFANFCAKQAEASDVDWAAANAANAARAAEAAIAAAARAVAAYWADGTDTNADIRKEQKQFLMELLK